MAIERAFGVLVRRWGILWRRLRFTVRKNIAILQALVILHNICTKRRDHAEMVCVPHPGDIGVQPSSEDVVEMCCGAWTRPESGRTSSRVQNWKTMDDELRLHIAKNLTFAGCFRP